MPLLTLFFTTLLSRGILVAALTRIAVYLGVGVVTYAGVSSAWSGILSHMTDAAGSVSGFALVFLQMSGISAGCNLVLSAIAARLALAGLSAGGVIKRLSWSGASGLSIFG